MHRHPRNSLRAAIPLTNANAPEAPAGDASGSGNGQTPPEQPSGNGGDAPSGMPGGSSFTAGDESMTLDLADAALTRDGETISTEDLAVDDILTVTLNASGKATTAEVVTTNGMGGAPGGFGGSGEVTQGTSANTIDTDTTASGTTVNISDSTITTTADNSGGIQTTGGATTNASNLTVDTSGNSAAAIRSDRGGGTVLSK